MNQYNVSFHLEVSEGQYPWLSESGSRDVDAESAQEAIDILARKVYSNSEYGNRVKFTVSSVCLKLNPETGGWKPSPEVQKLKKEPFKGENMRPTDP